MTEVIIDTISSISFGNPKYKEGKNAIEIVKVANEISVIFLDLEIARKKSPSVIIMMAKATLLTELTNKLEVWGPKAPEYK
jgi:hypothetical protein